MYSYSDTLIESQSQKTDAELGLVLFFHAGTQCRISTGADIEFGFGGASVSTVHLSYTAHMYRAENLTVNNYTCQIREQKQKSRVNFGIKLTRSEA